MNSYLVKVWVILLALKAVRSILLVLGSNVTRHSRNTACFLLGALKNDLHPVSF